MTYKRFKPGEVPGPGEFGPRVDAQGVPVAGEIVTRAPDGSAQQIVTEQNVAQAVATSSVSTPESLTGTGAIAITRSAHAGRNWHAEPGQTSLTLAAADWPQGGEFSIINHTGADLPVVLGAGWSGAFVNERDGNQATTGTLVTLPYLTRATVQVKGAYVNVALTGGSAGPQYDDWAANTRVKRYEVRRATTALSEIKIGDLIRSNSTRTTGATFNATEAGNWTEVSADPVTSVAGKTGAVTLVKGDVGLGNVTNDAQLKAASNLSDLNNASTARTNLGLGTTATLNVAASGNAASTEVVKGSDTRLSDSRTPTAHTHAQSDVTGLATALAAKQDTLVSGTNVKTVNGASVLGAGNIAVNADLPGGTATTVTDGGLATTGSPAIDRTSVAGQTIITWASGSGSLTVPENTTSVRVLVVAGGGGGGTGRYAGDAAGRPGGGGGAGGMLTDAAYSVTAGQTINLSVGAGGAGATDAADTDNGGTGGSNGGNSTFGTLTAIGGGGGGGHYAVIQGGWDAPANTGGSGGGGSNGSGGAAGTAGQGNSGGAIAPGGSGGGGAGGAGSSGGAVLAEGATAGAGGVGLANDITGASVTYAAGGASSGLPAGGVAGTNGAANTGNGGSGATNGGNNGRAAGTSPGGNGGSGIVVVRFTTQTRTYQALSAYASDAAAATGGILVGQFYRDSSTGAVRQRVS